MTEPGWRPDPNGPHRMRWRDGPRWLDLTVPDQATTRQQKRAVRDVRSSRGGLLKTVSPGTWTARGLSLYVIAALLTVIYVIPTVVVGGLFLWFLHGTVAAGAGPNGPA